MHFLKDFCKSYGHTTVWNLFARFVYKNVRTREASKAYKYGN